MKTAERSEKAGKFRKPPTGTAGMPAFWEAAQASAVRLGIISWDGRASARDPRQMTGDARFPSRDLQLPRGDLRNKTGDLHKKTWDLQVPAGDLHKRSGDL